MRAQRVREAENRVEMQVAKWTAEGAAKSRIYFQHTLVAGDMQVSRKAHGITP